ncbi:MAG: AtpZ/AtpI family protein [bacterium]
MDNNNQKAKVFYAVSLGLELGFLIAVPLVVFLAAGVFLDRIIGVAPVFLITFVIASLIGIFFEVRYLILPFLEKRSSK